MENTEGKTFNNLDALFKHSEIGDPNLQRAGFRLDQIVQRLTETNIKPQDWSAVKGKKF